MTKAYWAYAAVGIFAVVAGFVQSEFSYFLIGSLLIVVALTCFLEEEQ